MISEIQHRALGRAFPESDIEWRLGHAAESDGSIYGTCFAYITARAVMDRLDLVFGPAGWSDSLVPFSLGQEQGFVCRLEAGGVTREDVADLTDVQALKGGASGSLKRVAVKFGIGRYLYDLHDGRIIVGPEGVYRAKLKDRGQTFRWSPPALPDWAIPDTMDVRLGEIFVEVPIDFVKSVQRLTSDQCESQYLKAFAVPGISSIPGIPAFNPMWSHAERQEKLIHLKARALNQTGESK